MKERKQEAVSIGGVDHETLETIVTSLYLSIITINVDNVQAIFAASTMFQMGQIHELCIQFLIDHLSEDNCLGLYKFAKYNDCPELEEATMQVLMNNFEQVIQAEELLNFELDELLDLIGHDHSKLTINAVKLYSIVLSWIKHDQEERQVHVDSLLEQIPLHLLPRDFLLENVLREQMFMNNLKCSRAIIEAMQFHLTAEVPATSGLAKSNSCLSIDKPSQMWKSKSTVELCSPKRKATKFKKVNKTRTFSSNSCILVAGGFSSSDTPMDSCVVFDPVSKCWLEVMSMNVQRSGLSVVALEDLVFALGGFDGDRNVASCESYNPVANEWTQVPSMKQAKSNFGSCQLNGIIYTTGGKSKSPRLEFGIQHCLCVFFCIQ